MAVAKSLDGEFSQVNPVLPGAYSRRIDGIFQLASGILLTVGEVIIIKNLGGAGMYRTVENICSSLIAELKRAVETIESVDDLTYRRSANGTGSVGEQFRHNMDFLNTFLKGIAIGKIDYTDRERDQRVERGRRYAAERFELAICRLSSLNVRELAGIVSVRSELDRSSWLVSSVLREMEFVFSHTIHHHALIAEKLSGFGIFVGKDLGVAPSTSEHRRQLAA